MAEPYRCFALFLHYSLQTKSRRDFAGPTEVSFAGYPPARPSTWPGRQYTNLPNGSQAAEYSESQLLVTGRIAGASCSITELMPSNRSRLRN